MSEVSYVSNSNEKKEKELYYIITGRIKKDYTHLLNKYDISDPNSESVLKYCEWDDYRDKEEYKNFMVQHSDYYQTVTTPYSLEDLKEAVLRFLIPKGQTEVTSSVMKAYKNHLKKSEETYKDFETNRLTIDEKKACSLAISYYTGDKDNSDRISQNTNAVLRSSNSKKIISGWNEGEKYFPIIYYLTKAISSLPFYWGYTLRCIDLSKEQAFSYQAGVVVTWLNWSSSAMGEKPTVFSDRNCYFHIYSFSARDITKFSNYTAEKEALYPPFSHFLVFKNIIEKGHHHIYMRQIEIGLYPNNIIWVDDNILNKDWENKKLMEMAYYNSKVLKIIPKISTETALAFITSFKNIINNGGCKYKIISDMTRNNESPSQNAGARFVKSLQDSGFKHLKVMIFTSSKQKALDELKKLNAEINSNLQVTVSTNDAIKFLTMK
jgi:hypothetical protein